MQLQSKTLSLLQKIGHLSPQSVDFSTIFSNASASGHAINGWQEIVFRVNPETGICQFRGIDVYIGTPLHHELLFGTDCSEMIESWTTDDLWSTILPFCETVLSLSQSRSYIPIVRIEWTQVGRQHPLVHFFSLNQFDYHHRTWMTEVSSLAQPTTFLEH